MQRSQPNYILPPRQLLGVYSDAYYVEAISPYSSPALLLLYPHYSPLGRRSVV